MSHAVARKVWLPSGTADASTQIPRAFGVHGSWGTTWPSISVVRDVQFRPVTLSKFTQIGWGVRRGGALGWTRRGAPLRAPLSHVAFAVRSRMPRRDRPSALQPTSIRLGNGSNVSMPPTHPVSFAIRRLARATASVTDFAAIDDGEHLTIAKLTISI